MAQNTQFLHYFYFCFKNSIYILASFIFCQRLAFADFQGEKPIQLPISRVPVPILQTPSRAIPSERTSESNLYNGMSLATITQADSLTELEKTKPLTNSINKKTPWSGWFTMNHPLNNPYEKASNNDRSTYLTTPTLTTVLRYRPDKWFAQFEWFTYFNPDNQGIWDADFAYKFGYQDWRDYRLSFWYYNDGRNRFNPTKERITGHYSDVKYTHFEEGTISLKYNLLKIRSLPGWLSVTRASSIGSTMRVDLTPRVDYFVRKGRSGYWETMNWHQSYRIYANYNFTEKFYMGTTIYYYPDEHQLPWNPDYYYEVGFADWNPGKISIEYGNNSRFNRFKGHQIGRDSNFLDGTLSLSLYWQF